MKDGGKWETGLEAENPKVECKTFGRGHGYSLQVVRGGGARVV